MWCDKSTNSNFVNRRPPRLTAACTALAPLALLVLLATQVCADVQVTGNVTPARFPFNSSLGLPTAGNFIDAFYTDVNGNIVIAPAVGPLNIPGNNPTTQNNFECVLDGNGNNYCNPSSPTFDATHLKAQVNVGPTSYGEVVISGNTALRDQDLILGGTATGTGVFRVSGFGALYNNDPKILPFGWVWTSSTTRHAKLQRYDA